MSGKLTERVGDETIAEALRIAERRLIALGWRYSHTDVGKTASEIIAALDLDKGREALREQS